MRFSPPKTRRRSLFLIGALMSAGILISGALWSRSSAQDTDATSDIAPGITLRAVQSQTANGPLRYWLIKADKQTNALGLEIPDQNDAQKKRSVRGLAAQSGALVAVNGSFFAYGGAAVGAVKQSGQWQRLPWKSRTALGWNSASDAQIAPLSGSCQLRVATSDGKIQLQNAALNGWTLAGSRVALTDGFAVLTPQFARKYTLQSGEIAFQNGVAPLATGDVNLQSGPFWVVARGQATQNLALKAPPRFGFSVQTTPDWNRFANILGAGPRLVSKGQIQTTEVAEEFRPDVVARGPRTCVGLDAQKNWLLLVADGRSATSVGLTIPETAQLFQQLGAIEAMNLDGGSSTQLVVRGELVNTPSGFDPVNPTRPREVQVINALTIRAK